MANPDEQLSKEEYVDTNSVGQHGRYSHLGYEELVRLVAGVPCPPQTYP